MGNKVSVVTGATAGIGYQTALQLAKYGHQLILVFRNEQKGIQAREDIHSDVPGAEIELVVADLSSQDQIREAAKRIRNVSPVIDVLINNAGTWQSKRVMTEDNVEKVFAVNHLAYFMLTHLLYGQLSRSTEARVINVSSDSHFQSKMHFKNISLKGNYHGLRSYAQSKLANVLFTYEMAKRKPHDHVTVNAVQPGLVKTDIGVKHSSWLHALAWKIRRSGGVSPEEGAGTSVYLATSDEVTGINAKYWANKNPKASSKSSYIEEDASKLWLICEEMCGISEYFSRAES